MNKPTLNSAKRLFYRITGGRPMRYEGWFMFDHIERKDVYFWRDQLKGERWMANSKWSLFRVKSCRQ